MTPPAQGWVLGPLHQGSSMSRRMGVIPGPQGEVCGHLMVLPRMWELQDLVSLSPLFRGGKWEFEAEKHLIIQWLWGNQEGSCIRVSPARM